MADAQPGADAGHPPAEKPGAAPDIEVLTEKVYRLLLADVRLETARGGRGTRRG